MSRDALSRSASCIISEINPPARIHVEDKTRNVYYGIGYSPVGKRYLLLSLSQRFVVSVEKQIPLISGKDNDSGNDISSFVKV